MLDTATCLTADFRVGSSSECQLCHPISASWPGHDLLKASLYSYAEWIFRVICRSCKWDMVFNHWV